MIRLRWDTSLQWNNGRLVTEEQIERFKQQLHDWIDSKNDFAQYNCCCLVSDQAHFRDWGIPFLMIFVLYSDQVMLMLSRILYLVIL